jgi:chromosome segregation ATPase
LALELTDLILRAVVQSDSFDQFRQSMRDAATEADVLEANVEDVDKALAKAAKTGLSLQQQFEQSKQKISTLTTQARSLEKALAASQDAANTDRLTKSLQQVNAELAKERQMIHDPRGS